MRTITFKLLTNTTTTTESVYGQAFAQDDNATELVFDFTGTDCATWDKWIDLSMSDMTKDTQSLGTGVIVSFVLKPEHTKRGDLRVNPYAKSGTSRIGYPIQTLKVEKQLNNSVVDASATQSMIDYFDALFASDDIVTTGMITDGSVTPEKTSFIDVTVSPNIFDKTAYTSGKYLNYLSGDEITNASYGYSDFIVASESAVYSLYSSSDYQICFYDSNHIYISGVLLSPSVYSFTTPANCAYFIISFNLIKLDVLMIVKSLTVPTTYISYGETKELPHSYLPQKYGNLLVVYKGTGSKYQTIQGACNAAVSGDTVLVLPGVYVESVVCIDKEINIVGIDKNKCILEYHSDSYSYHPLSIAYGSLQNMTVHAVRDVGAPDATGTMPYAVHIDFDIQQNKTMLIDNCILINDWQAALGLGLKGGFKITLKNCDLITNADTTNGSLFFHDNTIAGYNGVAELIIDTCNIRNTVGTFAIMPTSYGSVENTTNMTFYRSLIFSALGGKTNACVGVGKAVAGSGWRTYNNFFLTTDSFGNNHALFNVV